MHMPFGKHRGVPLEQVPEAYLLWLLDNCRQLSPTLREAIQQQLELRPRERAAVPAERAEILRDWFSQMTLDFHPDHGGSNEAMRVVWQGYACLRKLLEQSPR